MRKSTAYIALILLSLSFIIIGCSGTGDQGEIAPDGDEVLIYATIYPVYDFAARVCGDRARVVQLVPDGVEPHDWEPSPKDMVNIQQADVIIYNGAGMETWVEKVLRNLGKNGPVPVDCSAGIKLLHVDMQPGSDPHTHDGDAGGHVHDTNIDPHIWLDPQNAALMVDNILQGVQKADPDNAAYYSDNARNYHELLNELDNKYMETLERVPIRKFIVSHAAFGYLAHRYNLEQVPIRGISPSADPSPARMKEIIETVQQTGVEYIFFVDAGQPEGFRGDRSRSGCPNTGAKSPGWYYSR